jgi:hypothetical protein
MDLPHGQGIPSAISKQLVIRNFLSSEMIGLSEEYRKKRGLAVKKSSVAILVRGDSGG